MVKVGTHAVALMKGAVKGKEYSEAQARMRLLPEFCEKGVVTEAACINVALCFTFGRKTAKGGPIAPSTLKAKVKKAKDKIDAHREAMKDDAYAAKHHLDAAIARLLKVPTDNQSENREETRDVMLARLNAVDVKFVPETDAELLSQARL